MDSSAFIKLERGLVDPLAFLANQEVVIPQVVSAEVRTPIYLEQNQERAAVIKHRIDGLLRPTRRVAFGEAEAEALAQLRAHCLRTGRPRGENDLMIAAHAVVESAVLLTADKRARFDDLPGVVVQHI